METMTNKRVKISPSLICMDLCNLERGVKELEELHVDLLHIDVIDGYFSPSMPIGLETVRQLRNKTELPFDIHIMAAKNDYFLTEILEMGACQVCFQYESEPHADRILNQIKKKNCKAGVALTPSTPVTSLEYILEKCDFILLMLINPGYADDASENQVPYGIKKVSDSHEFIRSRNCKTHIEVDGRVSFATIPSLVTAGADILVAGSKSLFDKSRSLADNYSELLKKIDLGVYSISMKP